jgi:hypothetical protein
VVVRDTGMLDVPPFFRGGHVLDNNIIILMIRWKLHQGLWVLVEIPSGGIGIAVVINQ